MEVIRMPVYFFIHQTSNAHIKDPGGTELDDELAAREYARQVARELIKRREPQSRPWRIEVPDSHGRQGFEVLFASADDIFAALGHELRASSKISTASKHL
jgi:hypothetical protein